MPLDNQTVCPLCCEEKPSSSMCILNKCSHRQCKDCILHWIEKEESSGSKSSPFCPFCRVGMSSEETEDILGRKFRPKKAYRDAGATETEVDELTHQWLREHTTQCQRCGHHIEKIDGCNKMECVCGYRFCFQCGTPDARCSCSPRNHFFWDNIENRVNMSRQGPGPAVPDPATGYASLRHTIQMRQGEKTRKMRTSRRQIVQLELKAMDAFTMNCGWLFCKSARAVIKHWANYKNVKAQKARRSRIQQHRRELWLQGEKKSILATRIISGQWLFSKNSLRHLQALWNAWKPHKQITRLRQKRVKRCNQMKQEREYMEGMLSASGRWLFYSSNDASTWILNREFGWEERKPGITLLEMLHNSPKDGHELHVSYLAVSIFRRYRNEPPPPAVAHQALRHICSVLGDGENPETGFYAHAEYHENRKKTPGFVELLDVLFFYDREGSIEPQHYQYGIDLADRIWSKRQARNWRVALVGDPPNEELREWEAEVERMLRLP